MSDIVKFQKIIPVGKQRFAYQCENASVVFKLEGSIPYRGGNEPYENSEKDQLRDYHQYDFEVFRHTANSIIVNFRKFYKNGKVELFTRTMSFSDFVNQVFCDLECNLIIEQEGRP